MCRNFLLSFLINSHRTSHIYSCTLYKFTKNCLRTTSMRHRNVTLIKNCSTDYTEQCMRLSQRIPITHTHTPSPCVLTGTRLSRMLSACLAGLPPSTACEGAWPFLFLTSTAWFLRFGTRWAAERACVCCRLEQGSLARGRSGPLGGRGRRGRRVKTALGSQCLHLQGK